jgi:Domain of unknown function (DUF5666)
VIRTTRQVLVSVALLAAFSLVSAAAWAQQPQPQSPPGNRPRPLGGSIASVSDNAFVLTTRDGRSVTVRTTGSTRIIGRQPATLGDIHAGDRVRIVATKAADGRLTAQAVQDIPSGLLTSSQNPGGTWQTRGDRVMLGGTVTGNPASGTLAIDTPNGQSTSVAVPSTARLSRMVSVPRSALAAGARVLVQGTPNTDGSVTASTVLVGGPQAK